MVWKYSNPELNKVVHKLCSFRDNLRPVRKLRKHSLINANTIYFISFILVHILCCHVVSAFCSDTSMLSIKYCLPDYVINSKRKSSQQICEILSRNTPEMYRHFTLLSDGKNDPEYVATFRSLWTDTLKQGLSVGAFIEDPNGGKPILAGCNMLALSYEGEEHNSDEFAVIKFSSLNNQFSIHYSELYIWFSVRKFKTSNESNTGRVRRSSRVWKIWCRQVLVSPWPFRASILSRSRIGWSYS